MIIKITIDRFENDKAILKTEDNETIVWPKKKLPDNINEGSSLLFIMTNDKQDEQFSKRLAKNILNEILSTGDRKQQTNII